MVSDLEKLSKAISDATPEKAAARELEEKANEIKAALKRDGFYENFDLGLRISRRVA